MAGIRIRWAQLPLKLFHMKQFCDITVMLIDTDFISTVENGPPVWNKQTNKHSDETAETNSYLSIANRRMVVPQPLLFGATMSAQK